MLISLGLFILIGVSFVALVMFAVSDTGWLFFAHYIFRKKLIILEMDDPLGEVETLQWKSTIEKSKYGLYSYRFPQSRIGHIILNEDGTGEYHSFKVRWIYLK